MSANNEKITDRNVDFAKWYTDVVRAAHLADYTSVKGCIAIEPNGYAIWEKMQNVLDKEFKKLGHVNCQMPLLIPENMLKKEGDLVNGFAPEVAWVTSGGSKELEERLAIRPTSETLFCDYYKNHITSYKDLPISGVMLCVGKKRLDLFLEVESFYGKKDIQYMQLVKKLKRKLNK